MKWITPHYYKDFTCTASDCRDNCCHGGWQIGLDEETVAYYRQVPGAFGEELRAAIDCTDEYCFRLKDGVCPLLDENGLCRVYKELGPEHMGVVCDQFPRFSEYFGSVKETGIGLACEEAARIILQADGIALTESELSEEEYEDPEFDAELYDILVRTREVLWQTLAIEGTTLDMQLRAILSLANKLQHYINDDDYDHLHMYVEELRSRVLFVQAAGHMPEPMETEEEEDALEALWIAFDDMDILKEEWEALRATIEEAPRCSMGILAKDYAKEITNLLNYYIFRYWTFACYDHNVLGAAQFMTVNVLALCDLWRRAAKPNGDLSEEDFMRVLHIFSRQVEYSKENIEILYENFIFDEVFEAEELIRLVTSLI